MDAPSNAPSITVSNAQAMPVAMHATNATYATDERDQDQGRKPRVLDAGNPVDNPDFDLPADHAFTAFLAGLTPGRVLRDREVNFSKVERKRARYLHEPRKLGRPRKPAPEPTVPDDFTARMMQVGLRVLEAKEAK